MSTPPPDLAAYQDLSERDWQLIAKNPDGHIGERVVVYGTVTQFDTATGTESFRINLGASPVTDSPQSYLDHDTNSMVSGAAEDLANVVRGDEVKIYGEVIGSISYDTQVGGNTTVPAIVAGMVEVTGHE